MCITIRCEMHSWTHRSSGQLCTEIISQSSEKSQSEFPGLGDLGPSFYKKYSLVFLLYFMDEKTGTQKIK